MDYEDCDNEYFLIKSQLCNVKHLSTPQRKGEWSRVELLQKKWKRLSFHQKLHPLQIAKKWKHLLTSHVGMARYYSLKCVSATI